MNYDEIEQTLLQMVQLMESFQGRIQELERENVTLIKGNKNLIDWIGLLEKDITLLKANMKYEIMDERSDSKDVWMPRIEEVDKTLSLIVEEHKSLCRFGDGEFSTIQGIVRHNFQNEIDEELGARLLEVLHSKEDDLLVAIADNFGSLASYKENVQREIRAFMSREERIYLNQILEKNRLYHNAYLSRPYALYLDQNTDAPAKRFLNLQKIWDKRECVFVEGIQTRMGVGNDLFSNAASIQRILAPAENAFRKYPQILQECLKMPKDKLFLLALGPTATVLAYDLCEAGYQAVDIGHLDLEYEWYLQGAGGRTAVPHKYNNECHGGTIVLDICDDMYESEIIARIA